MLINSLSEVTNIGLKLQCQDEGWFKALLRTAAKLQLTLASAKIVCSASLLLVQWICYHDVTNILPYLHM